MKKNPPWLVVLVLLPSIAGGYFVATHRPYIDLAGTHRPYLGLGIGALLIFIGARMRSR